MKPFLLIGTLLGMLIVQDMRAQESEQILAEGENKPIFEKKLRWGISHNIYLSSIEGNNLPADYYYKPSLGFNLRLEYYPISFLGVGMGFGVQQRGTGIINQDKYGAPYSHPWVQPSGDVDSTYIEKLRFNTLELPISLLLRTPGDVIKGMRLSGSAGIIFIHSYQANDVWVDVAGGNHLDHFVTDDYLRNDLGYQFTFGTDINAGDSNIIQVHFVYSRGLNNIYAAGQGEGQQVTLGLRVAWLF
jgi:hypothetical protein